MFVFHRFLGGSFEFHYKLSLLFFGGQTRRLELVSKETRPLLNDENFCFPLLSAKGREVFSLIVSELCAQRELRQVEVAARREKGSIENICFEASISRISTNQHRNRGGKHGKNFIETNKSFLVNNERGEKGLDIKHS
jgi:hypothetical protein